MWQRRAAAACAVAACGGAVVVAAIHVAIFVLESLLFAHVAVSVFKKREEDIPCLTSVMINQGVYNLFIAAGIVWALVRAATCGGGGGGCGSAVGGGNKRRSGFSGCVAATVSGESRAILTFFYACVIVAGIVGGITVGPSVIAAQLVPALVAAALLWGAAAAARHAGGGGNSGTFLSLRLLRMRATFATSHLTVVLLLQRETIQWNLYWGIRSMQSHRRVVEVGVYVLV